MSGEEESQNADSSSSPPTAPQRTRAGLLRTFLAVVLLTTLPVVGWVAASVFQSPDQRASEARPPEERAIVAPVTRGELVDRLNVRAEIGFEAEDVIASPASVEDQVVTEVFLRPGDEVRLGATLIALNDRPVFILAGAFPFYRDIEPGMEGEDVEQLQAAMRVIGHVIPSYEDGVYGWQTRQAVAKMYRDFGFEPRTIPDPRATQTSTPTPPTQIGPVLPMSEVVVARQLPARVIDLPEVGDRVGLSEGLVTVASGALVARAEVDPAVAVKLRVGLSTTLTPDGGSPAAATITSTSDEAAGSPSSQPPSTDNPAGGSGSESLGDQPGVVVITPTKPLPSDWLGKNVLVDVTIQEITGVELLAPERAVSSSTDGTQRVYVRRRDQDTRQDDEFIRVNVEVLGALAGQAAVRPVEDGALVEGHDVRVG